MSPVEWVVLGVLGVAALTILQTAAVVFLYVAIKCCDETAPYRAAYYADRYATHMAHEVVEGAEAMLREGSR